MNRLVALLPLQFGCVHVLAPMEYSDISQDAQIIGPAATAASDFDAAMQRCLARMNESAGRYNKTTRTIWWWNAGTGTVSLVSGAATATLLAVDQYNGEETFSGTGSLVSSLSGILVGASLGILGITRLDELKTEQLGDYEVYRTYYQTSLKAKESLLPALRAPGDSQTQAVLELQRMTATLSSHCL